MSDKRDEKEEAVIVYPGAFIKINIKESTHDVYVVEKGKKKLVFKAGGKK